MIRRRRWAPSSILTALVLLLAATTACSHQPEMVFTQVADARARAADLRAQFNKAVGASDRAVLADTDEASATAASEAKEARQEVASNLGDLKSTLEKLAYSDDLNALNQFASCFQEYQTLDDTTLQLAVENTNLKAQRLLFGPARESGDTFRTTLEGVVQSIPASARPRAEAAALRAESAVLHIQVLEARHIAEADEKAMSAMEEQMKAEETTARTALETLKGLGSRGAPPGLQTGADALDRFIATETEIVQLSRRNTNVRSTALALGHKRMITAGCEDVLEQLTQALAKHEFKATR